ncbi:MAG: hypothetical protein JW871_04795 [Endomicrobiales bacterium]|nr:hypothetical protein [Endomicrobiales bacterium]
MPQTLIIGAVVGIVAGLVPFIIGMNKNKSSLAITGFFACMVSGAILGLLLAVPVCIAFTWAILKKSKEKPKTSGDLPF